MAITPVRYISPFVSPWTGQIEISDTRTGRDSRADLSATLAATFRDP